MRVAPRRDLVGVALALSLGLAALASGCGPLVDPDSTQEQAAVLAERLWSGHSVGQTFVSQRARLSAVDVLLAVYPPGDGDDGELVFRLRTSPQSPVDLATTRVPASSARHNSHVRFAFAPQADSQGKSYYLEIEATTREPARATVWASAVDAYPDGTAYRDGQPRPGDLAFRAYYDYDLPWLARDLLDALSRRGWVFLPALAALILPGLALQRLLLRDLKLDAAEAVGLWLGLSVALAAVGLLLTTLVGLRLDATTAAALVAASAVVGLARATRAPTAMARDGSPPSGGVADWPARLVSRHRPGDLWRWLASPAAGAFAAAIGALLLRYVHARDLVLPMWGDSVQHALIAGLIAAGGQVPADYGPLVPAQPFTYHYGFHLQVALLHWLSGMEMARAVLFVGQLLSGLMVFPTYLLASWLAGDRRAGLVAGLIVGVVSVMPAYSVTWGRYPQLAGLAVLPAAAYLIARALRPGKWPWRAFLASVVASSGLALTHPRVALVYGCLVLAHLLASGFPAGPAAARGGESTGQLLGRCLRLWLRAGLIAGATVAVLAPWLVQLSSSRVADFVVHPGSVPAFAFPLGLLTTGFDRYLLAAALASVGLDILLRRRVGAEVALWIAASLAVANARLLGLPIHPMLSNDALAIMLFLPVAVLNGLLAANLARLARLVAWPVQLRLAVVAALVALGVWRGQALAGVVNPVCILAIAADVEAIRWVKANTGPDAAFVINSYRWQHDVYMGSDGGYWLSALAGRRTSVPPFPYAHGAAEEVARIGDLAEAIQEGGLDPAALIPRLTSEGFTHVFVGSRGGPLSAERLRAAPGYRQVYSNGRAWVFEIEAEPVS